MVPDATVWAAFGAGEFKGADSQQVRLFEVVELNPIFDRDNQTARLAAIITAYITGVATRLSS